MYRTLLVCLLIIIIPQLSYAAGEAGEKKENSYILEDFELSDSEKSKIENSSDQILRLQKNVEEQKTEIDFFYEIGDPGSRKMEEILVTLLQQQLIAKVNYYYIGLDQLNKDTAASQQELLEWEVRLILEKYLPEVFTKYLGFRSNSSTGISATLYYSGVSPDIVYQLVSDRGQEMIKQNSLALKNQNVSATAGLIINEKKIIEPSLQSIMQALGYKDYLADDDFTDLKIFVSYTTDMNDLPIAVQESNIVRLTRVESLKVADQLGINVFPFIFTKATSGDLSRLYDQCFVRQGEYFVLEAVGPVKFLRNRKVTPERIDVFVRAFDEASIQILQQLRPYKDQVDVELHMVMKKAVTEQTTVPGKFVSQGGRVEVEENLRLICLYKSDQDNFWNYINAQIKDPEKNRKHLFEQFGVDIQELEKCAFSEKGERFIKEALFLVDDLAIDSTPWLLWENQYLSSSVDQLEKIDSFRELKN